MVPSSESDQKVVIPTFDDRNPNGRRLKGRGRLRVLRLDPDQPSIGTEKQHFCKPCAFGAGVEQLKVLFSGSGVLLVYDSWPSSPERLPSARPSEKHHALSSLGASQHIENLFNGTGE